MTDRADGSASTRPPSSRTHSQNVAAKSFGQSRGPRRSAAANELVRIGPFGSRVQNLLDQRRLCSTSRIRTQTRALTSPAVKTGTSKVELIVGRIARRFAHIEIASAGAPDIAARAELACQLGAQDSSADGAVLQRGGFVVKFDEARKALVNFVQALADAGCAGSIKIDGDAARYDAIHHQPMTERDIRSPQARVRARCRNGRA